MNDSERRYRFPPREGTAGLLLGLTSSQVVGIVVGGVIALTLLRAGGPLSVVLIAVDALLVVLLVGVTFAGHTLVQWAPIMLRYVSGALEFRSALPALGHIVRLPESLALKPADVEPVVSLPSELADVRILETRLVRFGGVPLGVVHDTRADTYTATIRAEGRAFYLLGDEDRQLLLSRYGSLLASFATDDSPVRRVGWVERTLPAGVDDLWEHLRDNARPDLPDDDVGLEATRQLLTTHGNSDDDHECLVSLQVDAKRLSASRAIARYGGGQAGALALVGEQTCKLVDELARIGVLHPQPVGARDPSIPSARVLSAIIRNSIDPHSRASRQTPPAGQDAGLETEAFGPSARDGGWSYVRADGSLHCTGHLSSWPRHDVRAAFLEGILLGAGETRSVSVVMEVLGPRKATRRAERESEEAGAEGWLRHRIGRRTSAAVASRENHVATREEEIALGHALVRFSGFCSVSVPEDQGVTELQAAFARVQGVALASGLRLEVLHGEQVDALTFTVPGLCRGLR